LQQIHEALELQRQRNNDMEGEIDLRIRAEKMRLLKQHRLEQGINSDEEDGSYDGEDCEDGESEEEEAKVEPKVYEINDKEDEENF
jgi:hypothetical protein